MNPLREARADESVVDELLLHPHLLGMEEERQNDC